MSDAEETSLPRGVKGLSAVSLIGSGMKGKVGFAASYALRAFFVSPTRSYARPR